MPIIQLKDIYKTYGKGDTSLSILENVHLEINASEIVALRAPSGSGKSTLLHITGLLDAPSSGEVFIEGKKTNTLNDDEKAKIRATKMGFVYQQHHLLPEFTSLENIVLPQLILNTPKKKAEEYAYFLLELLHLKERALHRPSALSGGEQQRVALARSLANKPSFLLADEPTGNLDTQTGMVVFDMLLNIVKETKLACLIATHNDDLAKKMSRIITIKNKQCVEI